MDDWRMLLDGAMKGTRAETVMRKISAMNSEDLSIVRELVPMIIDTAIHYFLDLLDSDLDIDVSLKTPDGVRKGLRGSSDGLAGELYGSSGWIERFGQDRGSKDPR
jgi:hypothetical protein